VQPLQPALNAAFARAAGWKALPERELRSGVPWSEGVEAVLELDVRFRRTPWGSWTRAGARLANERIWERLQTREQLDLAGALEEDEVFCPQDKRFTLDGKLVRRRGALRRKVLDEVPEAERFHRYLPLLEMPVLGSADPKQDLRGQIVDGEVAISGWVDALGIRKTPSDRLFVVRLEGDSMEGGTRPLNDGAWLVLELSEAFDPGEVAAVQIPHPGSFSVVLKRVFEDDGVLRLVSQKGGYAPVEFGPEDAASVRVVARFVEELPPPRRTRSVDPDRVTEWVQKQFHRPERTVEDDPRLPPSLDGESRLLLTEKGLVWQVMLEQLPGFVQELQAAEEPVQAVHLRGRLARLPVPPRLDGYHLEAPSFAPLAPLLEPFALPGLPLDRATVFAFDGLGQARRRTGPTVRRGHRVRLLIPPGLTVPSGAPSWQVEEWTACDLLPGPNLPPDLGLVLAPESIGLTWACGPRRWERLADGKRVPVFAPEDRPVLAVSGPVSRFAGELQAVPDAGSSVPLPPGEAWVLELEGVEPGAHGIEVTPAEMSIQPSRRGFRVKPDAPPRWSAEVRVVSEARADLLDWQVEVHGPPLWPVRARWEGSRTDQLELCFGADGTLPTTELELRTQQLRRELLGRLVLDLGELGERVIVHERVENKAAIREELHRYLPPMREGERALIEQLAKRVLRALGWMVKGGIAHRAELRNDGLSFRPVAVVLVIEGEIDDDARSLANRACGGHDLEVAFVTNGREWCRHGRDAFFPAPPLAPATDEDAFMRFVRSFHWRTR